MSTKLFKASWTTTLFSWSVLAFLLLPTLIVIPLSFGDPVELVFPPPVWSVRIYNQLWADAAWLNSATLSLRIGLASTVLATCIAVPAAYGLYRSSSAIRQLVYGLFMTPAVVPVVVLALGIYLYFVRIGLVGREVGLVVAHAVYAFPFVFAAVLSGMKDVDQNLERAAHVMGASHFYAFIHIVLPLLARSITAGALFAFLMSFDETVIAYFLASTEMTTLPVRMFQSVRWDSTPILAAVSTLLTVLSFAICMVAGIGLARKSKPS
ncbi:putative spermidine/putrescine transport system permease protein [Bosea sp. OK403]|uniref:ABC transporter permease n=1 Tax=Bosea sp. OK403 TaxID=1855286 RepID=UPI0008E330B8|nr:ABC transporter permease [Bosea sp. OK403]SFJ73035.1 putative spermidine/putrescine transport system permease protein [Bosea sp. OK403]